MMMEFTIRLLRGFDHLHFGGDLQLFRWSEIHDTSALFGFHKLLQTFYE
jgi:hypothetical protein